MWRGSSTPGVDRRPRHRLGTDRGLPENPHPVTGKWPANETLALVDDDVQFSVYRPPYLLPGVWGSLAVFIHKGEAFVDPIRGPVDPVAEIEARVHTFLGPSVAPPSRVNARRPLPRGVRVRIDVNLDGVTCNPPFIELNWLEPIHESTFRVFAPAEVAGTTARGNVRVWCGPMVIADASIALPVVAQPRTEPVPAQTFVAAPAPATEPTGDAVREALSRYRKIFPSYSHADGKLVQQFSAVAAALGDRYLQDVVALRSGEVWDARLLKLIEEADVFQLFWSSNSMRSPYCQREWEHALALDRPSFVRPIYWEKPLPEDAEAGLPPQALRRLHFARLNAHAEVGLPPISLDRQGVTRPLQSPPCLPISRGPPTASRPR